MNIDPIAPLREQYNRVANDRVEFGQSIAEQQRQVQEARSQIEAMTKRIDQMRAALAYIEIVEKRLILEIDAQTSKINGEPPSPVAPVVLTPSWAALPVDMARSSGQISPL